MKKLSECSNNQLLLIYDSTYTNPDIMTKEELLSIKDLKEYINDKDVYIAESDRMQFDLEDIIKQIGEDAYEEWDIHVLDEILDKDETKAFLNLINEVFDKNLVYYNGELVYLDLIYADIDYFETKNISKNKYALGDVHVDDLIYVYDKINNEINAMTVDNIVITKHSVLLKADSYDSVICTLDELNTGMSEDGEKYYFTSESDITHFINKDFN